MDYSYRLLILSSFFHLSFNQYSPNHQYYPYRQYQPQPWHPEQTHPNLQWVRQEYQRPQGYQIFRRSAQYSNEDPESGRHFKPETIFKITETLGALNTVGRYLVNMTRTGEGSKVSEDVPHALYTISKNVLGRNVTDTIAPLVREALPIPEKNETPHKAIKKVDVSEEEDDDEDDKGCTTPEGVTGYCTDLSECPQLLLNLGNLRQSLCFKSLFVPGVCCPKTAVDSVDNSIQSNSVRPTFATTTSTSTPSTPVTFASIYYNTEKPTTAAPVVSSAASTILSKPGALLPVSNVPSLAPVVNNFVDPEECGQPENAKFRVVGGEEALPGRWPWMAAIFLHGSRRTEFWCGGSLITSTHVLTAAHCTRDSRQRPFSARQFTVRLGDVDLKRDDEPSAPVTFKVTEIRAHKQFSRVGFYNDIAILKLDRPARKSKYVIPLCLPPREARQEQFSGKRSTVVGWGTTFYGGKESTVQRQAILPVWRNEDCNQAYFQPITSNFICAGYSEGGIDACQGDSGGPLMLNWDARWIQIGVVSFGNKCGEPGYPGVYTRVTEYLDWIAENTRT
ncbi:proclotting enzyme isoform X2 [Anthonomus grandis grandis]|uniref:proclotting enzyme isoform X2 n=1 Tax=Anthonomus grandis grandis TaxID=2921223 RepID=UPI0021653E08|nr:proclotting enzyme isoform X2 [Anthonomus grandis grandis]